MKISFDQVVKALQICLILFFWSWALIWFSVRAARKEEKDRGFADHTVILLRDVPRTLEKWWRATKQEPQEILLSSKVEARKLGDMKDCSSLHDDLYLLHYRFEGNQTGKVHLQNIKSGEIARSWKIPLKTVFEDVTNLKRELTAEFAAGTIPVNCASMGKNNIPALSIHAPLMTEDSSLLFNVGGGIGYLYKLDDKSNLVWKSERLSHHSIELDGQGDIWTCSVNWGHPLAKTHKYREDAILCLGQDGKQKSLYSLSQILTENGLFEELVAATPSYKYPEWGQDPYHLNDVLPMKNDGMFWKNGDLFLSMRHKSMLMQYRPSDNSVVWHQQGPWLAQHDINVVSESVISVFNNNALLMPDNLSKAGSNIAFFDFVDGSTEFLGQGIFASLTQGRQTQTSDNHTLVEATNEATYILLDSTGAEKCRFYIPYYADPSHAMNPTWARLYLQEGSRFVLQ